MKVPGPVIFEALAVDPLGDIRHLEFHANGSFIGASDYLLKIATIPGRPIPHRLEWKVPRAGAYRIMAVGKDTAGKEVVSKAVEILAVGDDSPSEGWVAVKAGSSWRYSNDGTDFGTKWRETGFDDSKWSEGPAQLGYGDGDEQTVTRKGDGPVPPTAYFRHAFPVPADLSVARLRIRLLRDDGAVVYLNGKELVRDNMPRGDVAYATLASDSTDDENAFRTFVVEGGALVAGDNLLAVEVHQASLTSSDLGFDLELTAIPGASRDLPTVGVVATRSETSEPRPEARIAPGQFTVKRSGSTASPLTVLALYSGTATAGIDYSKLPNQITIPEGKSETTLDVVALDDALLEGVESVVVELVQPPILIDPLAAALPPPPTYLIDGEKSRAEVKIHDADSADDAKITILEPRAGSRFPALATIPIRALAVDPKGAITRLEFFAGEESIGVSEIVFIREPDPGTPIEHALEWKNPKPGSYALTAVGNDARGIPVLSPPVPVTVGNDVPRDVVVLEVEAADPKAVEPAGTVPADVGIFVVRRVDGPKDIAVPVFYSLDGVARNGVDYERLSGRTELPAGIEAVRIAVVPIGDKAIEEDEKVLLKLEPPVCPAIFPAPPECYQLGPSASAVVVISDRDDNGASNRKPSVVIAAPKSGSAFVEGEVIPIVAEATDVDGTIERLDILVDGDVVASVKGGAAKFDWLGAKPGLHRITARALDDDGADAGSPTVPVFVRGVEQVAFVHRDLPPAYLPGAAIEVALVAEPPRGSGAWAVEDVPPKGWAVSDVSNEGAYDAATGKVKLGPFTDAEPRRLTYRVTVPAGTTGPQTFAGSSSLDGKPLPVAGDTQLLPAAENHPADIKPTDNVVVVDELTAYAAAWKRGQPWGSDGGTIPVTYVARAGLIWKSGESYRYDPAAGAPPNCWMPAKPPGAEFASASRRGLGLAVVEVPTGVAERHAELIQKPGVGGRVEIHVQPPAGTQAVAVEETVPAGWRVSQISDDGVYDAATGRIRWGLFFGDAVR
ncbi:MAG: hypothetical protein JNL97_00545, partial [Verrucomicrobiales bacterium]|nr:hypothetical protein [Verrucomicrobiales bacterium]